MKNQRSSGATARTGRSGLCTCGSGKKHKYCCMQASPPLPQPSHPVLQNSDLLLQHALAVHQAGRFQEAAELYEGILRIDPEHADALHYSGLAAHQSGQTELAMVRMTRAIEREPRRPYYFVNLAQVLEARGELDQAVGCYRQAVSLDANLESAHYQLGHALLKKGLNADAVTSFSQVMRIHPESFKGASGLATALDKLGRAEQSILCFQKAIALNPAFVEAHNNMGLVLDKLGRFEEAIACFHQALIHEPDSAAVLTNLGGTLRSTGDLQGAIDVCHKAVALRPDLAAVHLNLANAYKDQGLLREAVCCYGRALALAPAHARAATNLAETLMQQDKADEAISSYQTAIATGSDNGTAYSNLLYLYSSSAQVEPAVERAFAEGWEKSVLTESERAAARRRKFPLRPRRGRKLRLGIVSAELGSHAVAVFLQSFLEELDRSRFHLTLFPTVGWPGPRAQHFHGLAHAYIPLMGVPDEQAAAWIRNEEIDVLIDTTGHTSNCRLGIFAHRAAPVQCCYIGYWSTTGLTEMDWYITDEDYSFQCDAHFTERLWRLPQMAHCYKGDPSLPESAWAPDADGAVWLGSFNRYVKIRHDTLRLWARVMSAIPNAKLLLEDRATHQAETHDRILSALSVLGVAQDRVSFLHAVPELAFEKHMLLHDRLDIALDTIPFNSGTTAFDALWMGVPLVAMEGTRVCGRMSSSIVRALGRSDWVAHSAEEYATIVGALARDVEGRKRLRKILRSQMMGSPLCDAKGLARVLGEAIENMYDQACGE